MFTIKSCQLCFVPIPQTVQHPSGSFRGATVGQEKNVDQKSMNLLWSYLYHQNIRECFSPSAASSINDRTYTKFGLPKLTFSFSIGGAAKADANEKDAVGSVRLCEQCGKAFEKLNKLHNELEEVKKSVECQVLSINNRISLGSNSIQSLLSEPVGTLDLSFGGSTIGRENVSKALRFLDKLCNDERPSPTNLNFSTGLINAETETGTKLQEVVLSEQPQTVKKEASNIMDASVEQATNFPSALMVSTTEISLSAVSEEGHFIMEVDTENVEYVIQSIKLEPEPETTETPASKSTQDPIPASVKTLKPPKSSSKTLEGYSKRSSTRQRLPSALKNTHLDKTTVTASKKFGERSVRITGNKKMDNSCSFCGKGFADNAHLIRHLRTHTGEKPFECEVCCQKFARLERLQIHRRIHTGERPFECEICHKKFARRDALKCHAVIHSGERPFKCEICKREFSRKSYLTGHQKTHSRKKNC